LHGSAGNGRLTRYVTALSMEIGSFDVLRFVEW